MRVYTRRTTPNRQTRRRTNGLGGPVRNAAHRLPRHRRLPPLRPHRRTNRYPVLISRDIVGTFHDEAGLLREILRYSQPDLEKTLTDFQIIQHILRSDPSAKNKKLLDAFKKAEELATLAAKEQASSLALKRFTQVRKELDELKERISTPLRSYQKRLATVALDANASMLSSPIGRGRSSRDCIPVRSLTNKPSEKYDR